MQSDSHTSKAIPIAVVFLLLAMAAQIAFSVRGESPTFDEGDHLFAGYMSLKTRDFGLNPEQPPMAKMVAALPLLPLALRVPALQQKRYFKLESYLDGRELIYRNGPNDGGHYSANTILFRARMAMMIFPLALALLEFFAATEMFGTGAGFIALMLFAFEPNFLANGGLITTDVAVSCMFFATIYAFYRWVKAPSRFRLILAGIALGLVLAAKHSGILLLPILLVLAAGEVLGCWWTLRGAESGKQLRRAVLAHAGRLLAGLLEITFLGVTVLWAFYGFRYASRPEGLYTVPDLQSTALYLKPLEKAGILYIARTRLLPQSYLYGLVDVRRVASAMPSYLFGKLYIHGVWFYFPSVIAIKLTLGTLGLLAIALYAALSGKLRRPREMFFLAAPVIVYLGVAMISELSTGVRHILPALAFMLALGAGGAWTMSQLGRPWRFALGILLAAHCISSLAAYPNYIPYANEAFGGPSQTHRYLADSASDWGQQLIAAKSYLDRNDIHDCYFAYYDAPAVLPSDYGIPCKLLFTLGTLGQIDTVVPPTVHGTVLISYSDLSGFEYGTKVRNPYQDFVALKPDAVIQDGIAVYNGDFSVAMAASLGHLGRSKTLLSKGDIAGGIGEAESAVAVDPDCFDSQYVLGNLYYAMGRKSDAAVHFKRALGIAQKMEPAARAQWTETLQNRIDSL
jgi:tetratricopeptide (TPR) repeat protein